jgi:NAD(P)-dependent dehydrogenase (short-subunit alcohol dehydrogenase family)
MMHATPVALVTGASRGIGRAIAMELAGAGWDVVVSYRVGVEPAKATVREIHALGRQGVPVQADMAQAEDRSRLVAETRRHFGRIDLLVNNAASSPKTRVDLLDADEMSFDAILAANLKGPYFLSQAVARWMIELKKEHPERRLSMVNISSISEYTPSVNRGDYCLAKAGMSMLTRLFAVRLAEHSIRVNEVRPGIIATDMTAGAKESYDRLIAAGLTPIRRWGQPADVARAVRLLAGPDLEFSTAVALDVDGGFHLHRL